MSLNGKITHRGPCTTLCLSLCPSHSLCRTRNIIYDFDSLLKNLMESVWEVVVGESLDSRSHMQFMHTQTTLSNLTACQKPKKNNQKANNKSVYRVQLYRKLSVLFIALAALRRVAVSGNGKMKIYGNNTIAFTRISLLCSPTAPGQRRFICILHWWEKSRSGVWRKGLKLPWNATLNVSCGTANKRK